MLYCAVAKRQFNPNEFGIESFMLVPTILPLWFPLYKEPFGMVNAYKHLQKCEM